MIHRPTYMLGISAGYITPAMTTGVLASSPPQTAGVASGILNAGRQVGGSIGVALMGTLVQTHHARGMALSLGLALLLSFLMAGIASRTIPAPHRESRN